MVYNLDVAKKFLTVRFDTTQDDKIGVYELEDEVDTYPVPVGKRWKPPVVVDLTSNSLNVHGYTLSIPQAKSLIQKLKTSHLVVNCDGACFVKIYDMVTKKVTAYERLVDAFPWPEFGVTDFKFKGFGLPKYATTGANIDPKNNQTEINGLRQKLTDTEAQVATLTENLQKNQVDINGLQKKITDTEAQVATLIKKLEQWRKNMVECFERAAALGARPLSPSTFNVGKWESSMCGDVEGTTIYLPFFEKFGYVDTSSFSRTVESIIKRNTLVVYHASLHFDTSGWWMLKLTGSLNYYAIYYHGVLGRFPLENPEERNEGSFFLVKDKKYSYESLANPNQYDNHLFIKV